MNKVTNILFCGIGGQGVLSASEITGWAALIDGNHVKKSEVHGMAQRGGSVESHLRFGKVVYSPIIPKGEADILVSFHLDEHFRLRSFLKEKGIDLINYLEISHDLIKDKKYQNIFLLGALSKHLDIKESCWLLAIDKVLGKKNPEENKKIFIEGRNSVKD